MLNQRIVTLHEDATKLEEITVIVKKTIPVILGNQAKRSKLSVWESTTPGAEIGIRLNIIKPTYINSVQLLIDKNECDTVFLRLNLYNLYKDSIG